MRYRLGWTKAVFVGLLLLSTAVCARAQSALPTGSVESIQDNSFLLEEAYNQDDGAVQHISSISRFWNSKDWIASFTQEWPVPGHASHQLSFTALGVSAGSHSGSGIGPGDFAINYRYQLLGSSETRLAISPRFSILLPSGRPRLGRGAGGTSYQAALPLSIILSPRFNTHTNLVITRTPHARNEVGDSASVTSYVIAQSLIFSAHRRVNLLVEVPWTNSADVIGPGIRQRYNDVIVSPGIRWSYNLSNGAQIVPGIAVPLGVGPSAGERGLILYFSVEHDYTGLLTRHH